MIFSRDFLQLVSELKYLVNAKRIMEAKRANSKLWNIVQTTPVREHAQKEVLEILGGVGSTLKDAGQMEMALPWFQQLCDFAGAFEPWSENTAWDYLHYAECLEAVKNKHEARKWLDNAKGVLAASGAKNDLLEKKINNLIRKISL